MLHSMFRSEMIYPIVLCALITLSHQTKDIINFNPYEEECINELYGDKNHLLQQLFLRHLFLENNDVVKKVVSCSWKKEGLINEDGEIIFDHFKKFLFDSVRKLNGCTDYLAQLVAGDALNHCKDDIENIVKLSTEEEECITETQIDRNVVLADKLNRDTSKNTLLNTYLGCYANKLADAGKFHFTKNIHVRLPGYNTPYIITSLYCDENYYSPANRIRPCVQRL